DRAGGAVEGVPGRAARLGQGPGGRPARAGRDHRCLRGGHDRGRPRRPVRRRQRDWRGPQGPRDLGVLRRGRRALPSEGPGVRNRADTGDAALECAAPRTARGDHRARDAVPVSLSSQAITPLTTPRELYAMLANVSGNLHERAEVLVVEQYLMILVYTAGVR